MPLVIENPYLAENFSWGRGNLHAHSTESDGARAPQDVIDDYATRGYRFLMLSDHDRLTDPAALSARGLTLIPGNEVSADGPHLLHVACSSVVTPHEDRQVVLNAIAEQSGLAVLCHPNWYARRDHYPAGSLEALSGYAGLEIYNAVIRRLPGSPLATDRWDLLLTEGYRLWGFANDDAHRDEDVALAWNVVQISDASPAGIVAALAQGRFYASTGVEMTHIHLFGTTLSVATRNASRITVIADGSRRVAQADGPQLTFRLPDDAPWRFVRVECWGEGEAMAWTQPFYLTQT